MEILMNPFSFYWWVGVVVAGVGAGLAGGLLRK